MFPSKWYPVIGTALILTLGGRTAGAAPAVEAVADAARIVVNEREIPLDVRPHIVASTVLVPLRFIGEALGAEVTWEPRMKVATIAGPRTTVAARIGDATVRAGNGVGGMRVRAYTSEAAPQIIGGRTMLPLRTVGLALGARVEWNAQTKTVTIRR
jgi:hypothetical protein